jgi:AraC family ethanolamine operon transcriptional activator
MVVIPMDEISSTRLNGRTIGHSLILMRGSPNCTVLETEGRLVAILSIDASMLDQRGLDFDDDVLLLQLPTAERAGLQRLIRSMLGLAATEPDAMAAADVFQRTEDTLLAGFEAAVRSGQVLDSAKREPLDRYKIIVDRVDELVGLTPIGLSNDRLAEAIGVSVRTLQKAAFSVCGSGVYRYARLRRLWSVRRQLRTGAPGLTVRASALAHGFWHQSEFSNAYRETFGELPSKTLEQARTVVG